LHPSKSDFCIDNVGIWTLLLHVIASSLKKTIRNCHSFLFGWQITVVTNAAHMSIDSFTFRSSESRSHLTGMSCNIAYVMIMFK